MIAPRKQGFQHTAARRRLVFARASILCTVLVSTHSRPKAAGPTSSACFPRPAVSTHSRPKAAGTAEVKETVQETVSTHSRPKAAGAVVAYRCNAFPVSTHSRPKAAGEYLYSRYTITVEFQHTAARRRLVPEPPKPHLSEDVSTHSRPKAAGLKF